LTCKELVELITDYLEGALSRRDRKRFERHLAACDGCTAYLAQMRHTVRTTRALADEDIPDAVRGELLTAFRGWKASG
jgi:anti-sigma factor RsiW